MNSPGNPRAAAHRAWAYRQPDIPGPHKRPPQGRCSSSQRRTGLLAHILRAGELFGLNHLPYLVEFIRVKANGAPIAGDASIARRIRKGVQQKLHSLGMLANIVISHPKKNLKFRRVWETC